MSACGSKHVAAPVLSKCGPGVVKVRMQAGACPLQRAVAHAVRLSARWSRTPSDDKIEKIKIKNDFVNLEHKSRDLGSSGGRIRRFETSFPGGPGRGP